MPGTTGHGYGVSETFQRNPMANPTPDTVQTVITRDCGRCVRCGTTVHGVRGKAWSIHHRRPRGMGGSKAPETNSPANLIILCGTGTTGCHGWVESHRNDAYDQGFLVPHSHDPATVPVHHVLYGWVRLTSQGTFTLCPEANPLHALAATSNQ